MNEPSAAPLGRPSAWQRICRGLLTRVLSGLREGEIRIRDADGERRCGRTSEACPLAANLVVRDPAFYPAAVFEQSGGVGRSYMHGWWTSDDVVTLVRILARNEPTLRRWTGAGGAVTAPLQSLYLWARRNTHRGARRNIAAHYDLGDDFYATFLDPSLTYSCAVFADVRTDLAAAQQAKLDRICRKLDLQPGDHVLEIGSGWGSFAVHAAETCGCRVTTTTISAAQARYVRELVGQRGLTGQVEILERDYRDLDGSYDKLVSVEMIEAVGTRYYETYFRKCASLLHDTGAMLLQAITVDDRHFAHDARHADFIKRFIFPGGVLPSLSVLSRAVARASDLQIAQLEDLTAHYVLTLQHWRRRLHQAKDRLRLLGKDEVFRRCWDFYFAYCEGGFRERRIGDVQMLLVKPRCRRLPALLPLAHPAASAEATLRVREAADG